MSYKKIDDLITHLNKTGISISDNFEKNNLINTGYFHGYKGYRFFKQPQLKLPFNSYSELYSTIQYDSNLKALFYDKIMFIETAVKNISLICILDNVGSESIQDMYSKVICSYNNAPDNYTTKQKRLLQEKKLNLQSRIQTYLVSGYKAQNPVITHYYNNTNYGSVPLWSLFEIITLGDLGYLLSCLTYDVRDYISKQIGFNLACDTNRELIYKYIYTIKDIRNAIAHNSVIFDTRFRKIDSSKAMQRCIEQEINLPYINFKTIDDYLILVCYYLKKLKVPSDEIFKFIEDFEDITQKYINSINKNVAAIVIHTDRQQKLNILKKFI